MATTTWTGATGTDWNNAGNWDNGVPTARDTAVFGANATVSVASGSRVDVQNLVVSDNAQVIKGGAGAIIVSASSFGGSTGTFSVGIGAKFAVVEGSVEAGPAARGAAGLVELRDGASYSYDGVGAFNQDIVLANGFNNTLSLGANVSAFNGKIGGFNAGEFISWSRNGSATSSIDYAADTVSVTKGGVTLTFQFADDFTSGQLQVDSFGNISSTRSQSSIPAPNSNPVAVADTLNATEDTPVTFQASDLLGNDTDADNDTLTLASVASGSGGAVTLNADGTVSFTPDANFNGAANFTYTVEDGQGGQSSSATVTVNVVAVNDAPVADLHANATIAYAENDPATPVAPALSLADVDSATLSGATITIVGKGAADSLTFTNANGISGSYDAVTGVLTLTGNASVANYEAALRTVAFQNGSDDPETTDRIISITVTDGADTSSAVTQVVNVSAANDAPVITGPLTATVAEGGSTAITMAELGFSDPDDVAASVVFTVTGLVNGSVLVEGVAAQSFTGQQLIDGVVSFEHDGSETIAASFDVSVEDADQDGSPPVASTFSITVTPINDDPVITGASLAPIPLSIAENQTAVSSVAATDVDNGAAELRFSISGGVDRSLFAIDSVTGALRFVSAPDFERPTDDGRDNIYDVVVSVSDPDGGASSQAYAITVTDVNDAPPPPATTATNADGSTTITLTEPQTAAQLAQFATPGIDTVSSPFSVVLPDGIENVTLTGTGDINATGNSGPNAITGNSGNNVLTGDAPSSGAFSAAFSAGIGSSSLMVGGADTITAGEGNDIVFGNQGADILFGNQGNDTLYGGKDDDFVYGGKGDDRIEGNFGNDYVEGNLGNDVVNGNQGNDTVLGNQGNDTAHGGQGDDLVHGGQGDDRVFGDKGNDRIWGDLGNDALTGGEGADTFFFALNSGNDVITDFNRAEGDRLDFQGQTYTVQDVNGGAVFTLSGGGVVVLTGVSSASLDASVFA